MIGLAGIVAVLLVGGIGTVMALVSARANAQQRDREAAVVAAAALSDSIARSTAALAGVSALAADGTVTDAEFAAFAAPIMSHGWLSSLAHSVVVTAPDRAAFERATGRPITERDADGRFVPAGVRPSYVPVAEVLPANERTLATLGFDITSDNARAAAAAEAGRRHEAVLSQPVGLAPTGRLGFFVIQPIFGPQDRLVGYVSTGLLAADLITATEHHLPSGATVGLRDADTVVAAATGGATTTISAGGRTWVLTVDDGTGVNPVLPTVVAGAGLGLALLVGYLSTRERRFARTRWALARRTQQLADLARELSAADHVQDVVAAIERDLPRVLAADVADIGLLAEGDELRMLGGIEDPELSTRYRRVGLDAHLPTTEAVRRRTSVVVDDMARYQAEHPDLLADVVASGLATAAVAPLLDADGAPFGVLSIARHGADPFGPETESVLWTAAELCGQALRRARDADHRHAFITTLQRQLLPQPPIVDGLDVLAHYQPATTAVGMGGDWYQFLVQPDGSLIAVIGDVVGHGVDAIAAMTQLQQLVAAAVRAGIDVDSLLAYVANAMLAPPAVHATAQLFHVDPTQDRLGYISAGHPFAILRDPDGQARALSDSQRPMLGIVPVTDSRLSYVDFPPGAALVAYTDGLIERRNEPITQGIDRLRRTVEGMQHSDSDWIPAILAGTSGKQGPVIVDDDLAIIMIRRNTTR